MAVQEDVPKQCGVSVKSCSPGLLGDIESCGECLWHDHLCWKGFTMYHTEKVDGPFFEAQECLHKFVYSVGLCPLAI